MMEAEPQGVVTTTPRALDWLTRLVETEQRLDVLYRAFRDASEALAKHVHHDMIENRELTEAMHLYEGALALVCGNKECFRKPMTVVDDKQFCYEHGAEHHVNIKWATMSTDERRAYDRMRSA
jgi:hypothetical protein